MKIVRIRTWLGVVAALAVGSPLNGQPVLIEAESFGEKGGWVLDTQAVSVMGSPYLLAHGLGAPVEDARTAVTFPVTGTYRLWVRTRDWVPDHPDAPGRFQVWLNGQSVGVEFGTVPGNWAWQDGGVVAITNTATMVSLHDLTGFDGRCDAIAFLSDLDTPPPNDGATLATWRRQMLGEPSEPAASETHDLVVVGGGLAGCSAAIAAAREGLNVALVQDRPILGGNASQEVRVETQGMVRHSIVESLRNRTPNGADKSVDDSNRLAVVAAETNITVYLGWRAYAVTTNEQGRVLSVDAKSTTTGEERRLLGSWFVDATGDGWIGYWSGADYRMGREARHEFDESRAPLVADAQTMGNSTMWNSVNTGAPVTFPAVPWATAVAGSAYAVSGGWNWEYGLLLDTIYDAEAIRDHLLRAVYGNFYNAKQRPEYANYALNWVCYVPGKRESRRLLGDHVLTENDLRNGVFFEDAVGMGSWPIDVHEPTGVDYRSQAINTAISPYYFPFRCLYSRNVPNLMMAGRCLSATHVGLGSPRVMHTCGQMGVAVGYAASICKRYDLDPRDVYRHPDRMLELQWLIGGDWPERPPPLVAVVDNADIGEGVEIAGQWISSTYNPGFYGTNYLHDGNTNKGQNSIQFTARLPESANYTVYLRWAADQNRASNVPVTLTHQLQTGDEESATLSASGSRSIRNSQPDVQVDAASLPVGRLAPSDYYRGLLDFDLSAIPDDATVTSVSLTLVVAERDAGSQSYVGADGIRVYAITEPVNLRNVTWNQRDAGTNWSQPGGVFDPNPLSIIPTPTDPNVVQAGEPFQFTSTAAFVQAIQSRLTNNTVTLLVRTPGVESSYNARKLFRFGAAGDPSAPLRPVLTVRYAHIQSGFSQTFFVDQRSNGSRWVPLGTFAFASNAPVHITLSNAGTDGYVMADAVAFGLRDAPSVVDRDGDGLPDWWERWHFLDETAASSSADADGDGQSNYAEFICGTLPGDARSRFAIKDMMTAVGSGWVLRWPSETNRTYTILTSPSVNGPFEILTNNLPATPPMNSFTTSPSQSIRFYRIMAELAEP